MAAAEIAGVLVLLCCFRFTATATLTESPMVTTASSVQGGSGISIDCNFDSGDICGYEQLNSDYFDWTRNSGPTLSLNTGPDGDHTTGSGHYMYIDARGKMEGDYAVLNTPILDWAAESGCLSFWVSMNGNDIGTLRVKAVGTTPFAVSKVLWYRTGQLGPAWKQISFRVETVMPLRLQFEGERGSGVAGDIAIDDVKMTKGMCAVPETTLAPLFVPTPPLPGALPVFDSTTSSGSLSIYAFEQPTTTTLPSPPTTKAAPITVAAPVSLGNPSPPPPPPPSAPLPAPPPPTSSGGGGSFPFPFPSSGGQNPLIGLIPGLVPSRAPSQVSMPFQSTLQFSCLRPSTTCNDMYGMCESMTGRCVCFNQNYGLRCDVSAAKSQNGGMCQINNPCIRGQCYDDGVGAACACPDGFYGTTCQHEMVHTICEDDRMVVNIFPYGFNPAVWIFVDPPGTETCDMLAVTSFLAQYKGYHSKSWSGFAQAFKYVNDPCAGNASIEWDTDTSTLYSRKIYVYYGIAARHPTDNVIKVTCEVAKVIPTPSPGSFPPPRVMVVVKDLKDKPIWGPIRLGFKVKVVFDVNVPNNAGMNDVQIDSCAVRDAFSRFSVDVVNNGCAEPPMGHLLYQPHRGRQVLMIVMHKFPGVSSGLFFQCKTRLQACNPMNPCGNPPVCPSQRLRRFVGTETHKTTTLSFVFNTSDVKDVHNPNTMIVQSRVFPFIPV